MSVTYRMETGKQNPFRRDFPHLYQRICRLADNIAGYHCADDVFSFSRKSNKFYDIPVIVDVSFEKAEAEQYERRMEAYLSAPLKRKNAEVPKPAFAVTLGIDFGFDVKELRVFDFTAYSDETLTSFCKEICEYAQTVYCFNFSPMGLRGK